MSMNFSFSVSNSHVISNSWPWCVHLLILVFLLLLVAVKLRRETFAAQAATMSMTVVSSSSSSSSSSKHVATTTNAENTNNNKSDSNVVLGKVLTDGGLGVVATANDNTTQCAIRAADTGQHVAMPVTFEAAPTRLSELDDNIVGPGASCIVSMRNLHPSECDVLSSKLLYDAKVVDKLLRVPSTTPGTGGHELACMVAFKPGAKSQDLQVYANSNTAYMNAPANTSNLKVDCQVGDWGAWSQCSAKCGTGTRTRTRKVVLPQENEGDTCPPLTETETCKDKECEIDCELTDWSDWSACSAKCGPGKKTRTRSIKTKAAHGGQECPSEKADEEGIFKETMSCQERPCPVDCKLTEWYEWSPCSAECGPGVQTRARSVSTPALNEGKECETPLAEVRECQKKPCPVHCEMSGWSDWSKCSKDCGPGTQVRTRRVLTQAAHGGDACPSELEETRDCEVKPCPVNCKVSEWTNWSACSQACGPGIQTRSRSIEIDALHGGTPCPSPMAESRPCNERPCPIDCKVSGWSAWSDCSKACGGGTQSRSRTVEVSTEHGGADCPELTESRACNTSPCAVDCKVGDWSEWSACSTTCGPGEQTRERSVETAAAHGGKACPVLSERRECQEKPCPVDCKVSNWTDWSACSAQCGPGTQTRTRTVVTPPAHGGTACPALADTQPCNVKPCPVDCKVSGWSDWSACSKSCGGGELTRTRTVITPAAHGGVACPALNETQSCNLQSCNVDCKVSGWSGWSSCTKSCEGGQQTRTRSIITAQAGRGAPCPPLSEPQSCNTHACPVDCKVSDWSAWSGCSRSCGGGQQTRSRYVTRYPSNNGAACPNLSETQDCNTQGCPENCKFSWGSWGTCDQTTGTKQRSQYVSTAARNGGSCSTPATETTSCPVDCVWTNFEYRDNPSVCRDGVRWLTRNITRYPRNGGRSCPATTESQGCEYAGIFTYYLGSDTKSINLWNGSTLLCHISIRPSWGMIVINSMSSGGAWGDEVRIPFSDLYIQNNAENSFYIVDKASGFVITESKYTSRSITFPNRFGMRVNRIEASGMKYLESTANGWSHPWRDI
jgi:Spondin-like TSP1 domain